MWRSSAWLCLRACGWFSLCCAHVYMLFCFIFLFPLVSVGSSFSPSFSALIVSTQLFSFRSSFPFSFPSCHLLPLFSVAYCSRFCCFCSALLFVFLIIGSLLGCSVLFFLRFPFFSSVSPGVWCLSIFFFLFCFSISEWERKELKLRIGSGSTCYDWGECFDGSTISSGVSLLSKSASK